MPRPPRIFFAGAIHHIVARGNNKMSLFHDPNDFRTYRKLWILAKEQFDLKIYRWVFMTNHVHVLLEQLRAEGVAEALHFVQSRYARYFCRKNSWKGHVWEGRYTSRIIADERYFLRCALYIENNPVKAGMITRAEDYPWSSSAFYTKGYQDSLTDKDPYSNTVPYDPLTNDLFIGRRAVGDIATLEYLSERIGRPLIKRSPRSSYTV
jgi:putative transposase